MRVARVAVSGRGGPARRIDRPALAGRDAAAADGQGRPSSRWRSGFTSCNAVRYVTRVVPLTASADIERAAGSGWLATRLVGGSRKDRANAARRAYCQPARPRIPRPARVANAGLSRAAAHAVRARPQEGRRRPAAMIGSTPATCGSSRRSAPTATSTSSSGTTPTSGCSKARAIRCFPQEERRYAVGSIKYVKQALISSGEGWLDADPEIRRLKPDIYAVNEDGDKGGKREYCAKMGHRIPRAQAHARPRPAAPHQHRTCAGF